MINIRDIRFHRGAVKQREKGLFDLLNDIFSEANDRINKNYTTNERLVLCELSSENGMSIAQMTERLGIKKTTISMLCRKLEKENLIYRRGDEADKRSVRVFLTDAGIRETEAMTTRMKEAEQNMLAPLTVNEQDQLKMILRKIETHMKNGTGV